MIKNKIISLIVAFCLSVTVLPCAFAAEEVLPTVTGITPADGTTEVPLMNVVVEVKFSTAMDKTTLNTKNITMSPDAIGKIEMSGEKKALIYLKKLQRATEYEITFTKGIRAVNGAELTKSSASFTTTAAYPKYRQLINSDMEDTSKLYVYSDAGANTISFAKDGDNSVLKSVVAWDEARVQQMVYLEPNAVYEMRARVKSNIDQKMRCVLNYTGLDSGGWYHYDGETSVKAGEWHDLSARFQIPARIDPVAYIEIASFKKGSEVFIDDWQFYEVGYDIPAPEVEISAAASALSTLTEDIQGDTDYQLLHALGIYEKKEYNDVSDNVTRESFAGYLAAMAGMGGMKSSVPKGRFSDIDESYEGYASAVTSMELMKADANGAFNPYGVISANDALRALVILAGYQHMLSGALPYSVASTLKYTDGVAVAASDKLTYAQCNKILNNFVQSDMGFVKELGAAEATYASSGETILEYLLGVKVDTGVVEATETTSLGKADGIRDGYVLIDGKEYKVINCDTESLIGKSVTYYVKEVDDEETVLYFAEIYDNNKILVLDAVDINGYSANAYEYYTGDKTKKAYVSTDKYFIYNYKSAGNYDNSHMIPDYGSVELIDNDRNGKYDVVKVLNYETFIVESVDKLSGVIKDKFAGKSITLDIDNATIYANGSKTSFDTISANNVITIARSIGGEYAVVYKSNDTVSGIVSEITNDDGRDYIVFYDEVHADEIVTRTEYIANYPGCDKIAVSETGIFYLDIFGKIAAFEKTEGNWKYGYYIEAGKKSYDEVQLRVLTENDAIERLEASKRLRIDDESYKENSKLYETLGAFEPQLIRYKLNPAGEIIRIVTVANGDEEGLKQIAKVNNLTYLSSSGTIGNKVYIDKDTKLFVVPTDHDGAEDYEYKYANAISFMYNTKTYAFTAYSNSGRINVADVLVMYDRPVQNIDYIGLGVVEKIYTTLNDEGEAITQIELKTSRSDRKIKVDDSISLNNLNGENGEGGLTCEIGDILTWKERMDGYATEINVVFKGKEKSLKTAANPNTGSFNKASRTYGGVVANIEDEYIRLEYDGDYETYNAMAFSKLIEFDGRFVDETSVSEIFEGYFIVVISSWNENSLFAVYKN